MRAKREPGIVGVNHVNIRQSQNRFRAAYCIPETRWGSEIEAGSQQVAGIQTVAYGQAGQFARKGAHGLQFLEPAAKVAARTHRVFQKHGEPRSLKSFSRVAQPESECGDPFFPRRASVTARVQNQVLGADGGGTEQFATKGIY